VSAFHEPVRYLLEAFAEGNHIVPLGLSFSLVVLALPGLFGSDSANVLFGGTAKLFARVCEGLSPMNFPGGNETAVRCAFLNTERKRAQSRPVASARRNGCRLKRCRVPQEGEGIRDQSDSLTYRKFRTHLLNGVDAARSEDRRKWRVGWWKKVNSCSFCEASPNPTIGRSPVVQGDGARMLGPHL
jgi:hypothetical protein